MKQSPKAQKVKEITEILEDLYPKVDIPLKHKDPYTLLISVLLSAQCTDKRVNEISPKLFKQADNPLDMVKMPPGEIEEIIRPCGLSKNKARAIYKLSQMLLDKYDGEVPDSISKLEELPGVGHKTASVVVAQAFGKPAFPVDTHIHRLAYRWGLSRGKNVKQTEKDLKRLFPRELWNKLHLQIIYYGREFSPARGMDLDRDIITRKYGRKSVINEFS